VCSSDLYSGSVDVVDASGPGFQASVGEVMAPSNETETEALQRRQVEALEAIAEHLRKLSACTGNDGPYRTVYVSNVADLPG